MADVFRLFALIVSGFAIGFTIILASRGWNSYLAVRTYVLTVFLTCSASVYYRIDGWGTPLTPRDFIAVGVNLGWALTSYLRVHQGGLTNGGTS